MLNRLGGRRTWVLEGPETEFCYEKTSAYEARFEPVLGTLLGRAHHRLEFRRPRKGRARRARRALRLAFRR